MPVHVHIARISSFTKVALPNARRAAYWASSRERPLCCCSAVSRSRCTRNSRSRSCSRCFLCHQRMSAFLGRPHDPRDRAGHLLPFRLLGQELLLSGGGEPVILEFALQILPRGFPLRRYPIFALQPV